MHAPRFDWTFNFGHVLNSFTVLVTVGGGIWYMSSKLTAQDHKIEALERARAQYMPVVEQLSIRQSTTEERARNLAEAAADQRRTNAEILSTLGTIRENVARIESRTNITTTR